MKNQISNILSDALHQLNIDISEVDIHIERPKTLEHGDYSSNIALQLAKGMKKKSSRGRPADYRSSRIRTAV